MARIDIILNSITLILVIILLFRTMNVSPLRKSSHPKVMKATNKTCPISGLPINHPGAEISEVELPNGKSVAVCSKHCESKVKDLLHHAYE